MITNVKRLDDVQEIVLRAIILGNGMRDATHKGILNLKMLIGEENDCYVCHAILRDVLFVEKLKLNFISCPMLCGSDIA